MLEGHVLNLELSLGAPAVTQGPGASGSSTMAPLSHLITDRPQDPHHADKETEA